MIWSVSTLLRRNGSAVPVWVVKASISVLLGQVGGAREATDHGSGRRDRHRDQVRPTALALPALEVAVGGRRAALAGRELVGVHPEAHRAAGAAPLGARLHEHPVEPLGLGL